MTEWSELPLLPAHAEYLEQSAITPEVAKAAGIYSATVPTHLPPELQHTPLPAIVFPWRSPTGHIEVQVRPDNPTTDENGRPRKYLWRKGMVPLLGLVRRYEGAKTMWIVEGTKQSLAAASYAPTSVEVYGIAGCRMWMHEGAPIPDLKVADGRDVVIILDADAATNRDVYDAGVGLAEALRFEGAASVKFVQLPGGKTAGLDDILAKRDPNRRAAYLERLVAAAKPKPADEKPRPKAKAKEVETPVDGRPVIVVNRDRLAVIDDLTNALRARWDGRQLFNHGGTLSWLEGHELHVLNDRSLVELLARTARTVTQNDRDGVPVFVDSWPDSYTIKALSARANHFAPIERVSRAPFVRADGSICQTPGYDAASRTVLVPDPGLGEIDVPEEPTQAEVDEALRFLRDEWLGDMPLPTDADKANVLALILTPFIRGLVPRVPLAVIDGLQMGVGKNLLADCIATLVIGEPPDPKPYTTDEEEQRKFITAAFRTGDELFVFDEAHTLAGSQLARALTSVTYSDRILGSSVVARFPNRVTWMSLGNNVEVRGDIARRVYRIRLQTTVDNPQDRSPDCFRHPDLLGWTHDNRAELLRCVLILIRKWFVAGQPHSVRGASFGSFEKWGRMVGGILKVAGQPGFLENLREWRSESDFDTQWWVAHLAWLHSQFDEGEVFTASDVRAKAIANSDTYQAPPGLDDPTDKSYARILGKAYSRVNGRGYEGYRLTRVGRTSGNSTLWSIDYSSPEVRKSRNTSDPSTPLGTCPPTPPRHMFSAMKMRGTTSGSSGLPESSYDANAGSNRRTDGDVVTESDGLPVIFDLETAGREALFSYGPGYVRLGGYTANGGIHITSDIDGLARMLERAPKVVGHNILGFDLIALARYHGVDIHELVGRGAVFDTLLAARYIDPPMARDKGVDAKRKYDLDTLGEKFGLGPKSDALKKLAKEFGGYDRIPLDDERYREYLRRDVFLSAGIYARLASDHPYLAREHRVAALAAQVSLNGFRIDLDLLAERLAEGERRRAEALTELHERYGIPLADDKGKPYRSPLATNPGKEALAEAFRRLGADRLPTTEKTGQLMTSGDAMAVVKYLYAGNPDVVRLADLVAIITGERTIYQTIEANRVGDRVHPTVSMEQATGRWSITNPGLTVLGKRGGRHREREVFLPEPGHVIISVDFSQIDARAIAGLSGDKAYAQLFAPGVDAHAEVARRIWGDPGRRDDAKAIGHGWNYGMGLRKLSETAGVPYEVAEQFDAAMRVQFPQLVEWREEIRRKAASGQLLDNGFGRLMRPDPERAHTQGPALMGQGAARDIAMEGLLRLPREVYPYLRAFIHDEVVLSVPADDADEVERVVLEALTFEWRGVPILAETQTRKVDGRKVPARGRNWGEVYAK